MARGDQLADHGLVVRAITRDNDRFIEFLERPPTGRGPEAVIALFLAMTLGLGEDHTLADQLLWLREDFRDPALNALARARFSALRAAVITRMPALAAAMMVEAQ